ncbi:MAG TPA: ATP-binding protein, partial [Vicinamibacterales bacterium]
LALKLHPDTERVFVISGTIDRDRRFESVARQALRALEDKIAVHYLTDLPLDELVVRTRTLPQRSIVLYVWQQSQTVDGRLLESADVLAAIAPSTHVPIYGMSAANIGTGMIGGHVFTLEGIGARAAEITLRILDGDRAADIPVEGAPTVLMFDWRQLERWGIQEDRLPPGSLFQFREPSFWRQYRWFIVGALAVGLIQAALIAGLLIQRSRRRRAELEAQMQQRELTHLARLAMLGELTGTLAHQLRQPLTAIMASAQAARRFLARQPVLQNELQECLEAIIQADDHAASVIQSTQGLLKKRIAPRQPVDLNTVVHDATRVVGSDLALRPIGITSALTPDLPAVLGQRVELQQVVLNLILNACDAMKGLGPERRTVTVSTELTQTGAVQVSVADQGTGIPLDSVARIFEPFFTLKEQGLGLGLTICRTIITAHGGQIWATPNTDVGATFSFTLPPDPTSRRRVRARAGAPNSDDVAAAVE